MTEKFIRALNITDVTNNAIKQHEIKRLQLAWKGSIIIIQRNYMYLI